MSEGDQYVVHRWKRKEEAGTKKMSMPIGHMYVDITLVKDAFLRYTRAM